MGGVKVCKSTYLFKVPETPNSSFSQLGHVMEMQRRRGGVHFLQGAPLCGPLGSNLVLFFPSDGVAFPGVFGAFGRCSGHRAVSSLQNLKRSSVSKAERRPHPPAIFSSTPLRRGREGEPGHNFQNKTLHPKLRVVEQTFTAVILCPLELTLSCLYKEQAVI